MLGDLVLPVIYAIYAMSKEVLPGLHSHAWWQPLGGTGPGWGL